MFGSGFYSNPENYPEPTEERIVARCGGDMCPKPCGCQVVDDNIVQCEQCQAPEKVPPIGCAEMLRVLTEVSKEVTKQITPQTPPHITQGVVQDIAHSWVEALKDMMGTGLKPGTSVQYTLQCIEGWLELEHNRPALKIVQNQEDM